MSNFYNQILNGFWTVLAFLPVLRFWIGHYTGVTLFWVLGISMIPIFLPGACFAELQLSCRRSFYESLGIRRMLAFTQDGYLVNRLIRKSKPGYRTVRSRRDLRSLKGRMLVYEKYHWTCLLFFLLTSLLALALKEFVLAGLILLANVIYNVVPLLIQQYNRARMG